MGSFVSSFREVLLKHMAGIEAMTPPTSWQVGLSVADFTADGTGFTEPADAAYAKLPVTWGAASARACRNSGALVWAMATEDWGPVYGYGLYDESDVLQACHRFTTVGSGILRNQRARFLDQALAVRFGSSNACWTTEAANRALEFVLRGGVYALPAGLWLALSSTTPTPAAASPNWTEVSGNAYDRVSLADVWAAMTVPGQRVSDVEVAFPEATGAGGFSTALGVGYYDAASGGNLILAKGMNKLVPDLGTLRFPAGYLTMALL